MYLMLDVGGTAVKAAFMDAEGKILREQTVPSRASFEADAMLTSWFQDLGISDQSGIEAVGLGLPGSLDRSSGRIISSPNLQKAEGFAIVEKLEKMLHAPVVFENDVNVFALGAYEVFRDQGVEHLLAVALGTGLGGGLIFSGTLYTGKGNAGEIGHMTFDRQGERCGCGNWGCNEMYASVTFLRKQVAAGLGRCSELPPFWRNHWQAEIPARDSYLAAINGKLIYAAASAGDEIARAAFAGLGKNLGIILGSAANLLHPEVIAVGGAIIAAREFFWKELEQSLQGHTMAGIRSTWTLVPMVETRHTSFRGLLRLLREKGLVV